MAAEKLYPAFVTLTLSSYVLRQTVAKQLKVSYELAKELLQRFGQIGDEGVIEFTKQGNVHYHYKMMISDESVACANDWLKSQRIKTENTKEYIFGFNSFKEIKKDNGVDNYFNKDINGKTERILRRLNLYDKYNIVFIKEPILTTFNEKPLRKKANRKICLFAKALDDDEYFEFQEFEQELIFNRIMGGCASGVADTHDCPLHTH